MAQPLLFAGNDEAKSWLEAWGGNYWSDVVTIQLENQTTGNVSTKLLDKISPKKPAADVTTPDKDMNKHHEDLAKKRLGLVSWTHVWLPSKHSTVV